MTEPADQWSKIPRVQAEKIQATVTSEIKFYGITIGVLTAAIAIMLLTIWMFYWVRKQKCDLLIKGAAECALAFYQASINNTVLGLTGLIVVSTCAITGRLIYLHYQTKKLFKDFNAQLTLLENKVADFLDNVQIFVSQLQASGIDIPSQLKKGQKTIMDTINYVINIKKQVDDPAFQQEFNTLIVNIKQSLAAANIPVQSTDALTILRQAQRVVDIASPNNIQLTKDTFANITNTWAALNDAQRQKITDFVKSLTSYTGENNMTPDKFDMMMGKIEWAISGLKAANGVIDTYDTYSAWFKKKYANVKQLWSYEQQDLQNIQDT